MLKKRIIIAIDGYSSTGKSTFARTIARALDYIYVDSGALYRAVCLFALQQGLVEASGKIRVRDLEAEFPRLQIDFKRDASGENRCYLNGRDVESLIRSLEVSRHVSAISSLAGVRNFVDDRLRQFGKTKGVVMEGRDIGTAVFPQAEVKIFMTAQAAVRARRRLKELEEKGEVHSYAEVLNNIESRDYTDSHRKVHPLRQAPDAWVLDNSFMTVEQQMQWFEQTLKEKCPRLLK